MGLVLPSWLYSAFFTTILATAAAEGVVVTPSNQEPVEGNQLSVLCSSDGGTAILWYKDGIAILSNSPDFVLPMTNFASSSTLTIESANHTLHSGHYACVAVFGDSSQASAPFNITVRYIGLNVGIQLDSDPDCSTGYILDSGCWLQLECFPPTGYPEVTVSWHKNEMKLDQAEEVPGIDFAPNARVLTIRNVTYDDSGSYQCRASNGVGVTRSSELLNITVQGEGRGFRFAENVSIETFSVTEGERLDLTCTVWDAVGKVIFKWLVMSDRVEEFNITSRADRSSLHIEHVTVMDEGMYYCVATDYQSQITKQFNVSVNVPRTLVPQPPFVVHGQEGERVLFHCVASGRPVPHVIWLFQSTSIPVAPAATESGLQDLGNGSLLIPALQLQHAGLYLCMIQTPPVIFHTFTLTVMPRNLPQPSVSSTPAENSTTTLAQPSVSSTPAENSTTTLAQPSVSSTPAENSTTTLAFSIGPFSQTVSIVLVAVCGLFILLLCSALLISLCCCCCSGKSSVHSTRKQTTDLPMPSRDFVIRKGLSEVPRQVRKMETFEIPLPSDTGVTCHYDNVALAVSGVALPQLPTFSSDESEAATTELETAISAVTDTQLMN